MRFQIMRRWPGLGEESPEVRSPQRLHHPLPSPYKHYLGLVRTEVPLVTIGSCVTVLRCRWCGEWAVGQSAVREDGTTPPRQSAIVASSRSTGVLGISTVAAGSSASATPSPMLTRSGTPGSSTVLKLAIVRPMAARIPSPSIAAAGSRLSRTRRPGRPMSQPV